MNLKYTVIIIFFVKSTYISHAWSNMVRPDNEKFELSSSVKSNLFSGSTSEVQNYNGNLKFDITDISLPGNGGLDIVIGRQYNADSLNTGLLSTYKLTSDSVPLGPGWKMTGILRVWHDEVFSFNETRQTFKYAKGTFSQICNNIRKWGGKLFIDLPNGSTERLYRVPNQPQAKTQSNWLLTCQGGQVLVYSPTGDQYDLGHIDYDQYKGFNITHASHPIEPDMTYMWPHNAFIYMSVKKVTDRSGNYLDYKYRYHGNKYKLLNISGDYLEIFNGYGDNPNDQFGDFSYAGGALLIESIKSSDGRELSFSYDVNTGRLTSIEDNLNRKWFYNYKNQKPIENFPFVEKNLKNINNSVLVNVRYPDNFNYKYEYYDEPFILGPPKRSVTKYAFKGGRLSKIITPQEGWISYDYESFMYNGDNGKNSFLGVRLKEKRLSSGEFWTYSYFREKNKLNETRVTGPKGIEIHKFFGAPYAVQFFYTEPNSTWMIGKPDESIYPDGTIDKFEWFPSFFIGDNNDNVFEEYYIGWNYTDVYKSNLSKKTTTRDGGLYITEYQNYDAYGNPGKVIETGPNGENRTTNLTYYNDPVKWIIGKPKDETTYNGSNLVGSITRSYDDKGQLLSENKDGVVNVNTYDAQGNIATQINANGATKTLSNYKRGIAQTEVQPEGVVLTRVVDNAGNVSAETNGVGHKTSYTYDALNRVTSITPPIGDKTTISYTPTSQTTVRGDLVEVTNYDGFGRPKDTNKGGIKTTYNYDAFNNKIFESYPNSNLGTVLSYDALNRVKTITNPDNTKQTYSYGKASTSITDERGKTTTYNYRSYGNPDEQHLMSIIAADRSANVTLGRNGRDQITGVTQGGLTRIYGYNNKYQMTSVNNPETGLTLFGRDNVGNVISQKVGALPETTLNYDGRNRNTSITYLDGTPSITKSYTKLDQLDTVTNSTTTRKFNYDANSNLTSEILTVGDINFTTGYQYNSKDHLQSIIYPQSGTVLDYAPDILGRPTKVGDYVTSINYWPSGQFKQLVYGNGTVTNYGQNSRLWPSQFETIKDNQKYLNSNYEYDGVGNLLTTIDSIDSSLNRIAGYDEINRLSSVQGPWGLGTINYDGVGNITQQNYGSQTLSYNYDGQNRLNNTSGIKTGTYAYDALGNIINDGKNQYQYNAVPSLTCINCSDASKKIEYGYDGLNKRVSVKKGGVTRYEVLSSNGDQLIEYSPEDNKLIEYFYLGGKRVAQKSPPVNMIDSILPAILSLILDDDE